MNSTDPEQQHAEDDLEVLVAWLADPAERPSALRAVVAEPIDDPKIIPQLQALLGDTSLCILGYPHLYGEVRYLAAHALYSEYRLLGIVEPISVSDVIVPVDYNQLLSLAAAAGLDSAEFVPVLDLLQILRDRRALPLTQIAF
ncbi:hypothetical protein ACFVH4_26835 [Nocardia ignorata]|uniref:hypothetical protein n=1 Tax=Nocardia ignorata TaxID=145285 RepID=UPI00363B52A5